MDNFNSERYFRELIRRHKIRYKLDQARQRRIDQYETEELYGKKNTPSLLSRIVKETHDNKAAANQFNKSSSFQDHDRISTSNDSGRSTSSGEFLRTYNDNNKHRSSPEKTMRRGKQKLQTDTNLPTAFNKLKQIYKLEKEKRMELLETIRLLRGISKLDFYTQLENNSEDDVCILEEIVKLYEKNSKTSVDENESQMERILSPIANQIPTPNRLPSPECLSLRANISPDPTPERVPSPDSQSHTMLPQLAKTVPDKTTLSQVLVADVHAKNGHKFFTQPSPQRSASDELGNDRFACYKRQHTLLQKGNSRAAKGNIIQKHGRKLQMSEQDTWRHTLLQIAYEKQWAKLKKPSLNMFPFQRSATMVSLEMSKDSKLNTKRPISSDDYVNFLLKRMNLS